MEDNKENKKKYLEIYSDLTKPLLTELSFKDYQVEIYYIPQL